MNSNGKTPVVIFSLSNPQKRDELGTVIPDSKIQQGVGCFEGQREAAYCVALSYFTEEVKNFLKADGQLAVLLLDNQYNAWLAYAENDYGDWLTDGVMPKYLGTFKQLPQTQAEKCSGWSRFDGKYYVASR